MKKKSFAAIAAALILVMGIVSGCGAEGTAESAVSEESTASVSSEETSASEADESSETVEESSEESESSEENEESDAVETTISASVETITVGDMEMDYAVFGSGEKSYVILPGLSIHSVMGSADAIAAAYESFAEEYTVYVFDRAKNIEEGYTVKDMADDTAAAMEALGIEDADIFGASQGGMIGLYLAIDHPELVHKMVLGSTLSKGNDTANQVIGEWITLAEEKDEEGLLESFADNVYSEATLEAYRDYLISSNKGITDEEYDRFVILANACLTFDCYDELSKISCPVLVLGSEGDQVVTAEGSKEIADALGCEIYLYDDGYGHGVYDEAEDYKSRILAFFEEDSEN